MPCRILKLADILLHAFSPFGISRSAPLHASRPALRTLAPPTHWTMFSLSSIRRKLPALPALPLPNSLPLGIPPWALLLIPLLGSLAAVYSLIRAAGSGSWWPGVEALDEAGTAVEDAELKEEKHFGRKSWQQSGASSTRCKEYDVIICGGGTTGEPLSLIDAVTPISDQPDASERPTEVAAEPFR